MILLDTNYLIRLLVSGSKEAEQVKVWIGQGEDLLTSAVCWYEFSCGPVGQEELELVEALLADRIIPYTRDMGREAARLYNAVGRKRQVRVDTMVAAAAIVANARLATANLGDFSIFRDYGLALV